MSEWRRRGERERWREEKKKWIETNCFGNRARLVFPLNVWMRSTDYSATKFLAPPTTKSHRKKKCCEQKNWRMAFDLNAPALPSTRYIHLELHGNLHQHRTSDINAHGECDASEETLQRVLSAANGWYVCVCCVRELLQSVNWNQANRGTILGTIIIRLCVVSQLKIIIIVSSQCVIFHFRVRFSGSVWPHAVSAFCHSLVSHRGWSCFVSSATVSLSYPSAVSLSDNFHLKLINSLCWCALLCFSTSAQWIRQTSIRCVFIRPSWVSFCLLLVSRSSRVLRLRRHVPLVHSQGGFRLKSGRHRLLPTDHTRVRSLVFIGTVVYAGFSLLCEEKLVSIYLWFVRMLRRPLHFRMRSRALFSDGDWFSVLLRFSLCCSFSFGCSERTYSFQTNVRNVRRRRRQRGARKLEEYYYFVCYKMVRIAHGARVWDPEKKKKKKMIKTITIPTSTVN